MVYGLIGLEAALLSNFSLAILLEHRVKNVKILYYINCIYLQIITCVTAANLSTALCQFEAFEGIVPLTDDAC